MKLTDFAAAALAGLLSLVVAGAALAQDPVRRGPAAGATAAVGDLAIGKLSTGPLQVGKVAVFRLVVRNGGTIPMGQGVKVTDVISSDFTAPITASGPGWNCAVSGQTVSCQYIGPPIAPGSSFPPITINAKAAVAGPYNNCAVVQSTLVPDGMPGNNQACISGNLQPALVLGGGNGNPRSTDPGGSPVAGPVGSRGPVEKGGPDAAGDRGPFSRRTDLSVSKRALGTAVVGQPLSFAITVTNNGPNPVNGASAVQITDTLDTNFTGPVTFGGTGWTCVTSLPVVTCYYSGSPVVFPGQALPVLTITARVGNAPAYTNCADVMLRGGIDPNPRNNRICIQGQTTPGGGGDPRLIDLSLSKRPAGPIVAGQPSSFELVVTNNGPSLVNASTGVKVVDTLPAGFTGPITGTGAGWTCGVIGTTITCTYSGAPPVPSGQTLPVLTITAVPGPTKSYVNCAVVSNRQGRDTNPGNDRACVEGPIQVGKRDYDVLVRKAGPAATPIGQTASFTLSPYNTGPAPVSSGTGVTVTDQLPPGFGPPTISALGWACNVSGSGPYLVTCNLTATTTFGANSPLPTITINTVANGPPGGYTNCAEISLRNARDVRPGDNKSCIGGEIRPKPTGIYDVGIEKKGPGPLTVGQTATFVLSPYNVGPSPVNAGTGVVVTDTLPSPPFGGNATVSGGPNWNCSASSGLNVSCLYIGPSVGQGQPLPPITITVLAVRPGRYQNCADIALTRVRDANPKNDRDCVEGPVSESKAVDISIRKQGPTSLTVGQTATFTLTPNNDGPATINASSDLYVADLLPVQFGAPVVASNLPNWTCTVGTGSPVGVQCRYVGPPVPAGTPFPPLTITAQAVTSGPWSNCALVGFRQPNGIIAPAPDVQPNDNTSCIEGQVVNPAAYNVGIVKSNPGALTVGQTATFTLTPTNFGPTPVNAASGVVVTDLIPSPTFSGTATVSALSTAWNCSASVGLSVSCTYIGGNITGPMPPIVITVVPSKTGHYYNCGKIALTGVGPDTVPGNNQSCVKGPIGPAKSDVAIRKQGPGPLTVGQTAIFTLTPMNYGPGAVSAGSGVVVTDLVPNPPFSAPATVSGGANWNCSASSGLNVSCTYIGAPVTGLMPPITVSVVATKAGLYTNCARISSNPATLDTVPSNNQGCVDGKVTEEKKVDVRINKTGPSVIEGGLTATFTLAPFNNGPATVTSSMGLAITDNLPINFGSPVVVNGGPNWTCNVPNTVPPFTVNCDYIGPPVPPTSPFPSITITARAGAYGPWTNCAIIGFRDQNGQIRPAPDVAPGDNRSCISGEVVRPRAYDVSIRKLGPGPLTVGQTATFTLNPTNIGPTPVNAASGVVVTDNLPSPPFGGTPTVNGGANWDCSASSGLNVSCRYVGGAITGPMPVITISVPVTRPGDYRNCAQIALTQVGPDTNPGNNNSCVEGPVSDPKPIDVSIRKSGPSVIEGGQIATFTLAPFNNGPATITSTMNLAVTDSLPINFGSPVLASNLPNWNCVVTASGGSFPPFTVTCDYIGPPVPQSGAFPLIVITARAGAYGTWDNCAYIGFRNTNNQIRPAPDVAPGDNRSCIKGEVVRPNPVIYDLSIDKSLYNNTASYNGGGLFNLLVTNLGPPIPPGGKLTITDSLPAGMGATSPTNWTCTPTSPVTGPINYVCTYLLPNGLPTSATVPMQHPFYFSGPQLPSYTNCATVAAYPNATSSTPLGESSPANNTDCQTVTLPPPPTPNLSLTKTLPAPCQNTNAGVICTFVFTITNNSGTTYTGPVSLTDAMTYTTANGTVITGVTGGFACTPGSPSSCQGNVSLSGGASTSFSATFNTTGPVLPTQNCAQLTAPVSAAQPGPSCVPITFVSNTAPVLSIEKVVEKDCTGTPPDTHCRFKVRVFNNGPGAYIGTVSFTDLVTSFGSPTGNVTLVAPFPSGWTCTGSQPMTCTSGLVTIPQNGMISATLWMDMQPPIPPDTNCARLTAPGLPTSCAGMGPPRFDMGVDSNFVAVPGQPGFHDFLIYVSSNPAVIPGYQIKINGSLTSAYGSSTFSPMTVVNSPNWTCSPTTWSAFQCIYTVPSGYSGGLIPLTLRTSYPTTAIGSAFNYTVTVTTIGNTDPNGSNNTRSVNGTLF